MSDQGDVLRTERERVSWGSAGHAVGCHGIRAAFPKCAAAGAAALRCAMSGASSGGVEQFDDGIRKTRELVKRLNNRLARNRAGLVERCLQGEVKLAIRCVDVGGRYNGIILESRPTPHEFQTCFDGAGDDSHPLRRCANPNQSAMFPRNVDIVEGDEKRVIPSTPRFQTFYNGPIGIREPLYLFTSRVFSFEEISAAGADWKPSVFYTGMAIAPRKDVDEHIQTAAETVNDCPDLGIENTRGHFDIAEANDFLSHLRVRFFGDTVGAFITPGFKPRAKVFELGYGPINACLSV
jgi:hypothetical protein